MRVGLTVVHVLVLRWYVFFSLGKVHLHLEFSQSKQSQTTETKVDISFTDESMYVTL